MSDLHRGAKRSAHEEVNHVSSGSTIIMWMSLRLMKMMFSSQVARLLEASRNCIRFFLTHQEKHRKKKQKTNHCKWLKNMNLEIKTLQKDLVL